MKTRILQILKEHKGYVSGQELCQQLGVSRTAVWKAINQLKEAGYEIDAVNNKGYRLTGGADVLTEQELMSIPKTKWLGKRFYCYEEINSTNTRAKQLADEGAEHGTVVVSEIQTQGRGRRGRQWTSRRGEGIWFSLILKPDIPPEKASTLTLVTALAVVGAIRQVTGTQPLIKWPNDVVLSGKKVCGILTELSAQIDYVNHIVVGIGINVKEREFPEEFAGSATTLMEEGAKPFLRAELLMAVLEEFEHYYELYLETLDMGLMLEEYNQYLVNRNQPVKVLDPAGEYQGVAIRINRRGELLVEREGSIVPVSSGEVSVRGIYGYV